jgi:hypothetical protein
MSYIVHILYFINQENEGARNPVLKRKAESVRVVNSTIHLHRANVIGQGKHLFN